MNDSSTSRSHPDQREDPLWLRTKRRLDRMETWSARHRITSTGFDERIQLQDERIALACRHLVLLLKERESNSEA